MMGTINLQAAALRTVGFRRTVGFMEKPIHWAQLN
jgi:hypothetical protein